PTTATLRGAKKAARSRGIAALLTPHGGEATGRSTTKAPRHQGIAGRIAPKPSLVLLASWWSQIPFLPDFECLAVEANDHRHVVGGALPVAYRTLDFGTGQALDQRRRHPDVVEPATAIGGLPVAVAIAPPRIEPLGRRNEVAHRIDEAARLLQLAELLDLERRVADDGEQLLVRPHVGLERRDVEI